MERKYSENTPFTQPKMTLERKTSDQPSVFPCRKNSEKKSSVSFVEWLAVPIQPVQNIGKPGRSNAKTRGIRRESGERGGNEMAGRRQSVTAQLQRQARRFSTAIAPQLTKIEPVHILQKVECVDIRIADIAQLQRAVEQYVLRNTTHFDPVEFDCFDRDGFRILQGLLYPDLMVLQEGTKKICEISFGDAEDSATCVAKIKHPVSSMTVYELRELGGAICIQSNTDEMNGCRILTQHASWAGLLLSCGCVFTKESWSLLKQDRPMATVSPVRAFFAENSIRVEWLPQCDCDLRLISLVFGLSQMVREAFPSLMHILKEFRNRRG